MHGYLRFKVFPWCFPRAKANRSFIFLFYACITFIYHDEMCLNYMLWMIHTLNVTSPFGFCKLWCTLSFASREALPGIPLTLFLMMQPQTPVSLPRQLNFVRHKKPLNKGLTPTAIHHRAIQISAMHAESRLQETFPIVLDLCLEQADGEEAEISCRRHNKGWL